MRAVVPWAEDELRTLAADPHSKIFSDQRKITVVLAPYHLQDLKTAVRELLNAGVNCYDKSLDGIFLGYDKLKVLSKSASVDPESSGVAIEIQANFYTFRPELGCILKGVVNKISNDHVGILVYQRFNITCPRPADSSKASKWIGNKAVMHQEVMFKLKDKNFSSRLPYFQGKIMEIGNVVTASDQEKKSKKKLKDTVPDESILSDASSQVTKKSRKHKLEETEENIQVKSKKSKKDIETLKSPDDRVADSDIAPMIVSSSKKKKVSISSVDQTDFIPRFSLDVSQLPEDLPPPNANSTHFDLTKNLSINTKSDKKKKKAKSHDLTCIGEESADGTRGDSRSNDKSQLTVEKQKKKHKTSVEEPHSSGVDVSTAKSPKVKKEKKSAKSTSTVEDSTPTKVKMSKLSKNVSSQFDGELENEALHSNPSSGNDVKNLLSPTKSKKKSKDRENEALHSKTSVGIDMKNPLSPSKAKKKSKEADNEALLSKTSTDLGSQLSPSKAKKSLKEAKLDSSPVRERTSSQVSDDFIPPGQKSFRASPKKQQTSEKGSPSMAYSPEMEYFSASRSMLDPELGIRRSGAQVPLIYGSFEGKIPPPPESPVKSLAGKKVDSDSDSDSPSPHKLIISSPKSEGSSDSSDSGKNQSAAQSKTLSKPSLKQVDNDTEDSESDSDGQTSFLRSMGVVRSPLKTAIPSVTKHDTSESESEGNSNEGQSSKPGKVSITKFKKPILASELKSKPDASQNLSPKKASKTNADSKIVSKGSESDSDDDLEAMKAAMLKLVESKTPKVKSGMGKGSTVTTKGATQAKKVTLENVDVSSKKKKPAPVTKPIDSNEVDSDSESEMIRAIIQKKLGKSKSDNVDVLSKKTKVSPEKKTSQNPNDKSSALQVNSRDSKNKPGIADSDDDDDDDTVLMQAAMQKVMETKPDLSNKKSKSPDKKTKQKANETETLPSNKTKAGRSKKSSESIAADSDGNGGMKMDLEKKKLVSIDVSTKKKNKQKSDHKPNISQVNYSNSKNKPDMDDSDDENDTEMIQAAMKRFNEHKTRDVSPKKSKASLINETLPKSNKTENMGVSSKMKVAPGRNPAHDSDSELLKSAVVKVTETLPAKGAGRGRKTKLENLDVSSKKKEAAAGKNSIKSNEVDSDSESEMIRAMVQKKLGKSKSDNVEVLSKKTKVSPVKKSSQKPDNKTIVPQVNSNKPDSDDSGDEDDTKIMLAALQKVSGSRPNLSDKSKSVQKSSQSKSKEQDVSSTAQAAPVKKTKRKANETETSDVTVKKSKAVPVEKPSNSNIGDSDSDSDLIRAGLQKWRDVPQDKEWQKRSQPKSVNKTPMKEKHLLNKSEAKLPNKLNQSRVKNTNPSTDDSDSGPDDINTTETLEDMRQQKAGTKHKGSKAEAANKPVKKPRNPKAEPASKTEQKPKAKKKASADDEISDVMQRLLRQAQLDIGMK